MIRHLILILLCSAATAAVPEPAVEDPKARAALPEFKVIPAATPEEQTPALAEFSVTGGGRVGGPSGPGDPYVAFALRPAVAR